MIEDLTSKYKGPTGSYLLRALFFEETNADKSTVLYTLKREDHLYDGITYPSLYRLYMETDDPTEWQFANRYFHGFEHWERICECTWFKEHIAQWRKELELKLKSEALVRIKAAAKTNGSKDTLSANRFLIDKGWEPKEGQQAKRGRPTKEDIRKAASEALSEDKRISEDMSRLGINVITKRAK